MDKNMKKYKIQKFAYETRIAVIILQFIANRLIPDHNSGTFLYLREESLAFWDNAIWNFFGGLVRWDAHYFMHIAKYGYTYENTLAFFPLYPLIASFISMIVTSITSFISEDSLLLIIFLTINVYLFAKSAATLYELTLLLTSSETLAYRAAFFFCINPASIFFTAPYTESLFCYLSFKAMLNSVNLYKKSKSNGLQAASIIFSLIPVALSICTRSNGLLSTGFVVYFLLKVIYRTSIELTLWSFCIDALLIFLCCVVCLIPFVTIQLCFYFYFCTNFDHNLPFFIVDYADVNDLVLPGMFAKYDQDWCRKTIPLAYNYVQERYWNVGFLRYYEFKQLPNFALAFPVILIIIRFSYVFVKQHKNYCVKFGIFNSKNEGTDFRKKELLYERDFFVFAAHAFVLTIFCILCVHIQVTTRMLCSASPVIYWYCAYTFHNVKIRKNDCPIRFICKNSLNFEQKCIKYYFLSYMIVGTVLFCNFFPWT